MCLLTTIIGKSILHQWNNHYVWQFQWKHSLNMMFSKHNMQSTVWRTCRNIPYSILRFPICIYDYKLSDKECNYNLSEKFSESCCHFTVHLPYKLQSVVCSVVYRCLHKCTLARCTFLQWAWVENWHGSGNWQSTKEMSIDQAHKHNSRYTS